MRGRVTKLSGTESTSSRPRAKTMKQQKTRKRIEAAFIEPMQCKPVTALPAGEKWSFEIKFDGYRCIAVKRGQEVTLFSRHKKVLNKRFPGVVDALASLDSDFVLDGELVALDSQGRPSFQILQNNLSRSLPVYFYCFDLLNRDGETLVTYRLNGAATCCTEPVFRVREIRCASRRYCERHPGKFLRQCASSAWKASWANGSVPIYEPGERSGAWIKLRTNLEQEFVIGGYIPGTRGRLGVTRWQGCGRPRDPPFHFSSMPISLRAGLNRSGWGRRPYCLSAASPS